MRRTKWMNVMGTRCSKEAHILRDEELKESWQWIQSRFFLSSTEVLWRTKKRTTMFELLKFSAFLFSFQFVLFFFYFWDFSSFFCGLDCYTREHYIVWDLNDAMRWLFIIVKINPLLIQVNLKNQEEWLYPSKVNSFYYCLIPLDKVILHWELIRGSSFHIYLLTYMILLTVSHFISFSQQVYSIHSIFHCVFV